MTHIKSAVSLYESFKGCEKILLLLQMLRRGGSVRQETNYMRLSGQSQIDFCSSAS